MNSTNFDSRIPPILHPLLSEYVRLLDERLPGQVLGVYLEGSFALDAFNPRLSDIDFITVLDGSPDETDFAGLVEIHREIGRKFPRWKLEGRYLPLSDLGHRSSEVGAHLHYLEGRLHRAEHFPLCAVTWWTLKERGITLSGPSAQSLDFEVDLDYLLQTQRENMNSYWASWTRTPVRILALLTDWGVQWTVLGVLRQFYCLREKKIVSKVQAGEYGLVCLPEQWHALIREAVAIRETGKSSYRSKVKRAVETHRFLKFIISTSNSL